MAEQGVTFSYSFSPNLLELAAMFEELGHELSDFSEPLARAIRQVMIPSISQNFSVGGRPAWEPVSDATSQIKGSLGVPMDTLVRTGMLKASATSQTLWSIDKTSASATMPDTISYGGVHQEGTMGTQGRGGNIPARPFIAIQPEDEEAIAVVFDNWLEERLGVLGWG